MSDAPPSYAPKADDHAHAHGPTPLSLLIGVWASLVVLTGLTYVCADTEIKIWISRWCNIAINDVARMSLILAMTIATVKAGLVCLYFMHLRWERSLNSIVFVTSLIFVALFLGFALFDSVTYRFDPLRQNVSDEQARRVARPAGKEAPGTAHPAPAPAGKEAGK